MFVIIYVLLLSKSQILDICPKRGVCGKANNPGTNYLSGE
jgi:hypothetical protein